jgi:LysM repeat protein
MSDKELHKLQQQIQDYQHENQNLQQEVKKWSQYCAYVAGTSVGIILFLQIFATSEPEIIECELCEECPEPVELSEEVECPELVECPDIVEAVQTPKVQKTQVLAPKDLDPTTFPRSYVIQKGDNFSIIAQKIYGRASWAKWLADQNGVDPSKLQIGQEITLPVPKN